MRRLLEAEEVKEILSKVKIGFEVKEMPILDSLGKVSSEDVFSRIDIPPFRRSTRDGFAVLSGDVTNASEMKAVRLKVVGKIEVGESKRMRIKQGEAVEVSTGSMIPENADAVVMIENVEVENGNIWVKKQVSPGENVMNAGSDVEIGEVILRRGEKIDEMKIGLLSGAGYNSVRVRIMRIGIISTGDELVKPGEPLKDAGIYDVNSYTLFAQLKMLGAEPVLYGIVRDDEKEMEDALRIAAGECDAVLTSGSTSAGRGDLLYKVVEKVGKIVFHGVRVKPGKPFFYGEIEGKPVFGLPGFPTSCLTIFTEFVKPVIARNLGIKSKPETVSGRMAKRVYSEGRREFLPVFVVRDRIHPIEKGSGAITSLSEASGYIEILDGEEVIERGSAREVRLFGKKYDYLVAGCDIIDLLELDGQIKRVYMNPELARLEFKMNAIDAVFFKDGEYRIPYGFAGKKGKSGAASHYSIDADVHVKNHSQLLNLFRLGKLDGVYMLKPFADRFGIEIEILGEIEIGFESIEELEKTISDQLNRLTK